MKKFFSFVAAVLFAGSMMAQTTVYDWAAEVGTTVLGTTGVEISTVKIHTNTDEVAAIKFSSSYVYADGKYIAIKPAEGGFKAGDVLSVAAVFSNSSDTKRAQVDVFAADGATRLFLSDSASTINGRTSAGEPIVQTYTLEANQDSLLIGRNGNTNLFITMLSVAREATPAGPTNCAEAREAALSVSANNELYNNGAVYTIEGYVTGIKTAYSDQFHNISFWMADAADGGEVLQAYRAACATEADAPKVGDKVAVTGSLTKYGTTPEFAQGCTFVITEPYIPVEPEMNYYVTGSMTSWGPNAAYMLTPSNDGLYKGEFTFAANDQFKVTYSDGTTIDDANWFPGGMDNNYVITEAGDYAITFNPAGNVEGWYEGFFNVVKKEAPIVHQYEVAEAIAAGLQENDEVLVRGVITKMEFKGKNFAKYGSVNIYVADATGAEGEFEFYNCYSLNADTFRTSTPAYDAESTAWAQFNEVADENGNAIHVGDTVIAFGKYKLYNSTHELNTGCYLVDVKHSATEGVENVATDQKKAIKKFENGVLIIEKNGIRYNATGAIVK